ncbi:Retrotransposon-derived protein PEG10 [Smittium mucronatum]|uniref:Retrotransposon-derived protein PEG10 n=1 Tax=Smittium mucronatum TaxID=133383 RepID=A0A1R0H6D7_9FUNG|nr:Retrotransposon-derived protein PEG10 [Smittium mucronatum]
MNINRLDQVKSLAEQLRQLTTENELLRTQLPNHVPKIALPEIYEGNKKEYRGFVDQCNPFFFLHPHEYPTDAEKVTANDAIRSLRQGKKPVENYASEFRRLAMDLDRNKSAIASQFEEGLNNEILDILAQAETPATLESLIETAIRTDTRLAKRKEQKSKKAKGTTSYTSYATVQPPIRGEPMQVDVISKVKPEERERRIRLVLCFYFGGKGQMTANCPKKTENHDQKNQRIQAELGRSPCI